MAKKYYWLKLQKDFFKRHDIRIIEAMPNGKDYILFYLKLLVESVGHEGNLRFSDTIPYNDEMLATITNTNIDVVRSAMNLFTDLQMVDVLDDMTIYMSEVERMIGSETDAHTREQNRIRQQRFRDKQKALPVNDDALCNVTVTLNRNAEKEIEKEIELDIEKEKDIEIDKDIKEKEKKENTLTLVTQMCEKYQVSEDAQTMIEEWARYKMERKEPYKERGANSLVSQLSKNIEKYGEDAVLDLIDECMANNWKGIIWEKLEKRQTSAKPKQTSRNLFDELANC